MATFPAFSPVETSVAEQIITRLAGMGTWNCPCGMTAVGVLNPAAERVLARWPRTDRSLGS